MNKLNKYFTPEELEMIHSKGPEFLEKFENQQKGQIYKDANFLYNRTQLKQMEKAAEKYPEPLNDESWTTEELIDHAFQELVDQSHYLAAINKKMKAMENELKDSKDMAHYWRNKYRQMKMMYEASVDPEKGKFKI